MARTSEQILDGLSSESADSIGAAVFGLPDNELLIVWRSLFPSLDQLREQTEDMTKPAPA